MRILRSRCLPYHLPLRLPWHSARGRLSRRQGWLIRLETESGIEGFGDCAPLTAIGTESPGRAAQLLARHLPSLPGQTATDALAALPDAEHCPATRCGIESALLDLLSKEAAQPLRRWLNPDAADRVRLNASIGTLNEGIQQSAETAVVAGFQILKLKVGVAPISDELRYLKQLCRRLPAGIQLRLDANGAWEPEQAQQFIRGLEGLPVESLEEPLQTPDPERLTNLQAGAPFDLALDESIGLLSPQQILTHPPVRRLILKPMARGGLLPTLELARQADEQGLRRVITSSIESAAGIWACAQLAAALDGHAPSPAHGLDTSHWLAEDLGAPPPVSGGWMVLGEMHGSGFAADGIAEG